MNYTDNFKTLARRSSVTVQDIRNEARSLGLSFKYSPERRTWTLNEPAAIVSEFNRYLSGDLA